MKAVLDSLDATPEALKSEYELRGDKYHLKIEGAIPGFAKSDDLVAANRKIVEFRDTNIALLKEVEPLREMKLKLGDLDPDEAVGAVKKVKALGQKGIKDIEDFDTKVRSTVEDLVKPLREQLAASAAETTAERRRADEFLLHTQIVDKFVKLGGKPKAADFVVGLSTDTFEVKDKKVVAKTGKFSTEKPGEPLDIDEWLTNVTKEHDYVLEPSKGGNADRTANTGPRAAGAKPLKAGQTVLKNPTPQQLGEFSSDIVSGKVRVEYETATA